MVSGETTFTLQYHSGNQNNCQSCLGLIKDTVATNRMICPRYDNCGSADIVNSNRFLLTNFKRYYLSFRISNFTSFTASSHGI